MPYVNYRRLTTITLDQVSHMLATDDDWLERAIVKLHDRQTDLERQARETLAIKNEIGLQRADALLFSKYAEQLKRGTHLSDAQKRTARRPWNRPKTPIPTICKYRRQVLEMIENAARRQRGL